MLEVRFDHNRHCVCVFNRGPKITHYLGTDDGPELRACQLPHDQFETVYGVVLKKPGTDELYTPMDFALNYMRDESARKMIPLSAVAIRVLMSIIKGQSTDGLAADTLNSMESIMAKTTEEAGFRKPEGPVAQVHKYLDSRLDAVKAGTVSRKELIEKLVEKGFANGTVVTQCGVWARNNGVTFPRPTQAAENKSAKRAKAAKKAAK